MTNHQDPPPEKTSNKTPSLDAISLNIVPSVSDKPDEYTLEELDSIEKDKKLAELTGLKQDIAQRKDYAEKIFKLVCVWLLVVLILLILQGFNIRGFSLDEAVLLAVIGSTTINIIGLFYVVANYLFPKK